MLRKSLVILALFLFILPIVSASDLKIISADYSKTIKPCETATFSFVIQNIGANAETYYLGIDYLTNYASFSQNPVVLGPSQSQEIVASISPACEITGNLKLNILVSSLSTNQQVLFPIELSIAEDYDYEMTFGKYYSQGQPIEVSDGRYTICEADTRYIPLIIENEASTANSYKIGLRGPGFASLTQNTAVLGTGQQGVVFIALQPKVGDEKAYTIAVYVTPEKGKIEKIGAITIDVEECYGVEVNLPKEAIIANCEESHYTLGIHNTGKYPGSFDMLLSAPEWITLSYSPKSVNPDGTANATLNFNVPCEEEGKEKISVKAVSQTHQDIEDVKKMVLKVVPQNEFYHAVIDAPSSEKIRYDAENVEVQITNHGFEEIEYTLSLNAPNWVDIQPKKLTLKEGETGTATLALSLNDAIEENDYLVAIEASAGSAVYSESIVLKLRHAFLSDKLSSFFTNAGRWLRYWMYYIIAFILLIAVIVMLAILIKRKMADPAFREKIDEIKSISFPKQLKIALWSFLAIVVAAILIFYVDFSSFSISVVKATLFGFVSTYIWFIIAGLAILAVVLFFLINRDKKIYAELKKQARRNKAKKKKSKK